MLCRDEGTPNTTPALAPRCRVPAAALRQRRDVRQVVVIKETAEVLADAVISVVEAAPEAVKEAAAAAPEVIKEATAAAPEVIRRRSPRSSRRPSPRPPRSNPT